MNGERGDPARQGMDEISVAIFATLFLFPGSARAW
jgi:hypothetical protein